MFAPRGFATLLASLLLAVSAASAFAPPGLAGAPAPWPSSSALVVSEVETGGTSASDEFVELYNAGSGPADLAGDELVYVTASGATITRKAAWDTSLQLAPGQHLLVVNSAGIYAQGGDAAYSGGLSADGGSIVLRHVGGAVIDAIGWGTAANGFVEGSVAPAPAARSSLERMPGAGAGNSLDTNDNSADWFVQPGPNPQSLAAAAVPARTPAATDAAPSTTPEESAAPTAGPTAAPTTEDSAAPTVPSTWEPPATPTLPPSGGTPTPASSATTTAAPTEVATPSDTPAPSPAETPAVSATPQETPLPPTPAPTPTPPASVSPTPPAIALEPISVARSAGAGTLVRVAGTVTAPVGSVGAANLFAIGDETGGIFIRLEAICQPEPGQYFEAIGTLADPYGQLEVRELEWFVAGEAGPELEPIATSIAYLDESLEGSLVTVEGTVESVSTDGSRLAVTIVDDGTRVRLLADPISGIDASHVGRGRRVRATGILGQRATATGRLDGYRIWLRKPSDLQLMPEASPVGSASLPPNRTPGASPTAMPVYHDLATALLARGRSVDVTATVTVPVGIVDWGGPTIVVDDGTASVAVVLLSATGAPRLGAQVRVIGQVGSLHSAPRVVATSVQWLADGTPPAPQVLSRPLSAADEWHLVKVSGRIARVVKAGSRWRIDIPVNGGMVSVLGEPAAGISAKDLMTGRLAVVSGVVRRSTSDASSFSVLPRFESDVWLGPIPTGTDGGTAEGHVQPAIGTPDQDRSSPAPVVSVVDLPGHDGQTVTVAGLVVATRENGADLDDGTGNVRLGGPDAADALSLLEIGDAIEAGGLVTRDGDAWLIEVDPETIVALAGPTSGSVASVAAADWPPSNPLAAANASVAADQGRALAHAAGSDGSGWLAPFLTLPMLAVLAICWLAVTGLAYAAWRKAIAGGTGRPHSGTNAVPETVREAERGPDE